MESQLLSKFYGASLRGFGRAAVLVLTVLIANLAAEAIGQPHTLPIDDTVKNDRGVAFQCLKNPQTYAAEKVKFENYFSKYYFPAMTRTEPEALAALGKMRDDIFKALRSGTVKEAQDHLTNLALESMKQIVLAQDPAFHAAVRYNAILIVGLLDQKYGERQPPEPLPAALKPLTVVVDMATTSTRFPPSVTLGAVIGLDRHAQYKQTLSPEAASGMTAALIKLVEHADPIQEMDRDTYSWLRLRAAGVLAKLGSVGEKNAVHNAIVKLATTARSLDDRCAAAGLLEKLEYKDVKLDDATTAEPLFALARDLAAAEDKKALKFQEDFATGGGFAAGTGGFNPDGTPVTETFPRRQVLSRLVELRNGLKKVKPSLTEESQKKADAVITALNTAITATSDKGTVELTLVDTVRKMAEAINAALPAAAASPADKPPDAFDAANAEAPAAEEENTEATKAK